MNLMNLIISQHSPSRIVKKTVKNTLKKLNSGKELKKVQKLLRGYTDNNKSHLDDDEFIQQLVNDTEILNLLSFESIKPVNLKASLSALLLRVELFDSG